MRQADADFTAFEFVQNLPLPTCHKLHFLQMACEKLVKAHLCGVGTEPRTLQSSHAYVADTLPVVLRQQAVFVRFTGRNAKEVLARANSLLRRSTFLLRRLIAGEDAETIASIPWEDSRRGMRTPLDWTFNLWS